MTISTQTFRFSYVSTGGTVYPYTNKILSQDDLTVYVQSVLKTIGTDYTVSGVGSSAGGNVTLLAAPTVGHTILITKDGVEITQETDYVENDAFPAESHENALDKLTNIAQKIWDYTRRSIKLPITSSLTDLEFPSPEAGKSFAWNGAATAIENITLSGVGGISDTAYNSTTWDGMTDIAPSKNAVRDKIEAMISDDAYNSTTWDGITTSAPSKNAVRDKIESMVITTKYLPGYGNLLIKNNTTHPTYQLDVTADYAAAVDSSGNLTLLTSVSGTVDISASGANGLDTGAKAVSTWYYIFVIAKTDGTKALLLSLSSTAPTMPAGYTYKLLLGSIRNNAGNNFVNINQLDDAVVMDLDIAVVSAGTDATYTAVDIATAVPPIAKRVSGSAVSTSAAGAGTLLYLFSTITGQGQMRICGLTAQPGLSQQTYGTYSVPLAIAQTLYYAVDGAGASGYIYVSGWGY